MFITRSEGRQGEWNEYVEFSIGQSDPKFVAQKSAWAGKDHWFVYEVGHGKHGGVRTIGHNVDKAYCEKLAHDAAVAFTEGKTYPSLKQEAS